MERIKLLAENWQHFAPFMLSAGTNMHFNIVRIIEGLLIAAVTAFAVMYGTQRYMEGQMEAMKSTMDDFRAEVRFNIGGIKTDIKDMREDLYAPIGRQ